MSTDPAERPSKSQRKRDHHSLIELARKLITLSDRVRKGFELDDDLHAALQLAASMKPSSARERQLRYIAKSLEKTDYAAIHAALEEREKPSRETVVLHHQAEQWRDRLIAEETTVDALLEACPSLTRSAIQTLVFEARQQAAAGKPPKAARQLFRAIRDALNSK